MTHPAGGVCLSATDDAEVAVIGVRTWNEVEDDADEGWSLRSAAARYVLAADLDALVEAEVERRLSLRGAAE